MTTPPTPNLDTCRLRRQNFIEAMQALDIEQALITRADSICWLTGVHLGPLLATSALVEPDGSLTLCLPTKKAETPAAADRVVTYDAKWLSTMRNDQPQACIAALLASSMPAEKIGAEFSQFVAHASEAWQTSWEDVEPIIWQLRRHKYDDELAMLAWANEANRRMYEHARQAIQPGLNELDLYNQLYAVAVHALGEPLTYFGQDFRCAARGGAPRNRVCQAGELYILDLGVGYRGYYSDNARTIAVGGEPTSDQLSAWKQLAGALDLVRERVRPGLSCKQLFDEVKQLLAPAEPWLFNHHLGHGVGLAPHEGPHLNANWDDTFAVGDFFTAEPGLYHDNLNHGIRLEQNYLVTEEGVQLLTDWPLELV